MAFRLPPPAHNLSAHFRRPHVRLLPGVRARIQLRLAGDAVIRASKQQLSLLESNLRIGGQVPVVITARRRREDLPENNLERQICDFLAWRGFISTRQHVGLFVPYRVLRQLQCGRLETESAARNVVKIGEEGIADWWSARPIISPGGRVQDGPWMWQGFFWEAKAPRKKPSAAQLAWLDRRRQVGLESAWFNQFEPEDRTPPAGEPRDSHVFTTWFFNYEMSCAQPH